MHDTMTPEQICNTFVRLRDSIDAKVAAGLQDRRRIAAEINSGKDPAGPRVDWLKETALALVETLKVAARKYNATNAGERISGQDLLDALATTRELVVG